MKLKGDLKPMLRKGKRDSKRVVLVDCSSVTYAALHAMGHLSYDGQKTGIIYGFFTRLLIMAEKFKTNNFIFCWDAGTGLHRTKAYPEYKKKRNQKKQELTELQKDARISLDVQSKLLNYEILPAMGFRNSFVQEGFEADDLLGWWCNKMHNYGYDIVMVTSDADMYQCLNKCRIWSPLKKKFMTEKQMVKKFGGTTPEQWPLAKAIGGCSGDGVIGIQGISDPKVQTSKVHKYLRGELTKGVVFDRIKADEGQEIIEINLPLVTVPYREDLLSKMILRRNYYSRSGFIKQFDKYHLVSLLKKNNFKRWKVAFDL